MQENSLGCGLGFATEFDPTVDWCGPQNGGHEPHHNGVFFPQLNWNHQFPTEQSSFRRIDSEVDRATTWTTKTTADSERGVYIHNLERCGNSKEATLNSHVRQWCERRLKPRILSIPFSSGTPTYPSKRPIVHPRLRNQSAGTSQKNTVQRL